MNPEAQRKFGAFFGLGVLAILLTAVFVRPAETHTESGIIETIAGSFPHRTLASEADLPGPPSAAVDREGNVYIATFYGQTVLKLTRSGHVVPFSGKGIWGFSGDGGPATDATMALPVAVALDKRGDVFILDAANNRVRRVDAKSGIITTVAGNGSAGFSGDGGPATSASINISFVIPMGSPIGLDDGGNLFIADEGNERIRRVDATTGIIDTVAGNGTPGLSGDGGPAVDAELDSPSSVAVTASGAYFINDSRNLLIRSVDENGIITTYAGNGGLGDCGDGGPALNACLFFPEGLAVDSSGDLFIADTLNDVVRRVDGATQIISTIAGNGRQGFDGDGGPATQAELNELAGVAVASNGDVFIVDTGNNRIRQVNTNSAIITTVAGGGTGGDGERARKATFADAFAVTADIHGDIFITDAGNNRIRKVDHLHGEISTVAGSGFLGSGGDGGPATNASLSFPEDAVAVDSNGNFYIGDTGNLRVRRVDGTTGLITTVAGNGAPCFVTTDPCGDGGPAIDAGFLDIFGVALDSHGNLFISDGIVNRIRRVDASTGIITTVAGNGNPGYGGDGGPATSAEFNLCFGVNVDSSGNLFIGDAGNNRIRRVDAVTGIITTVVGNGNTGYSGDGGPATSASLNFPLNAPVDAKGNLFVADAFNNVVRYVAASSQIIQTIAGNGIAGFSGDGGPATDASLDYDEIGLDHLNRVIIGDAVNNRVRSFRFVAGSEDDARLQNSANSSNGERARNAGQPSFASVRLAILKSHVPLRVRVLQACQAAPRGPACSQAIPF